MFVEDSELITRVLIKRNFVESGFLTPIPWSLRRPIAGSNVDSCDETLNKMLQNCGQAEPIQFARSADGPKHGEIADVKIKKISHSDDSNRS